MLVAYESTLGQSYCTPISNSVEADVTTNNSEALAATVEKPCVISRFDSLMQEVGEEEGFDWRFMSAIAYSESRFIENLKSSQGSGVSIFQPV